MKNSGLFLNMENCVFGFLFFWGFILIVVCFLCVYHKSVKNACFPQFFGGFSGVAYYCSSGFGRFRCFGVFCFWFFFFVLLLFLFCLLCYWFCGWMLLFFFLFFCFVFFGGFKGQVRWPEGPPHLALNPPYFICFCFFGFSFVLFFFFFFFFCFFVFFGRV